MRSVNLGNLLWRAGGHDQAATVAALWPDVDQPVGGLDDVSRLCSITYDGVALIDQCVQHLQRNLRRPSSKCRPVVGSSRI